MRPSYAADPGTSDRSVPHQEQRIAIMGSQAEPLLRRPPARSEKPVDRSDVGTIGSWGKRFVYLSNANVRLLNHAQVFDTPANRTMLPMAGPHTMLAMEERRRSMIQLACSISPPSS